MQGLIGRKVGMTRIFKQETGQVIPVTIIKTGVNKVIQVKTQQRDGYSAVQLGFEVVPEQKLNQPVNGHLKKHNCEPMRKIKEFNLDSPDENLEMGQSVGAEMFNAVQYVDVTGISKGRGYAGTVKRHGFHIGRMTHGNKNKREPGSIGCNTYPARVFPGKKMAGQYGNRQVTSKNLEVVGLDANLGIIYLKGCVPGRKNGIVFVKKSSFEM